MRFDNARFLDAEWNSDGLPQLSAAIATLENRLQLDNIPPALRVQLRGLTRGALHQINRLRLDKPTRTVLATKLAFSALAVTLVIPPLLKMERERNYQYLSLLMANYFKTLLMMIGIGLNRTADAASYRLNIKERHAPVLISMMPYLAADVLPALDAFSRRNPLVFNAMAAVFMALAYAVMTAPSLATQPLAFLRRVTENAWGRLLSKNAGIVCDAASDSDKPDFNEELNQLTMLHEDLRERRALFEAQGFRIGDVLSAQLADLDGSLIRLGYGLRDGSCEQAGPLGQTPRQTMAGAQTFPGTSQQDVEMAGAQSVDQSARSNPDFTDKASLAALTAVVCLGSAATYYKEPIGLISLTVRSGLAVAEMLKTVFNPSERSSRASEKFSSYSGLSLLLLPYGIVNNIPATHFTGHRSGLIAGTTLLGIGNLLLPRPISEWLGGAMVSIVNRCKTRRSPVVA